MKQVKLSFICEKNIWVCKQHKLRYRINKNKLLGFESKTDEFHYTLCFKHRYDALQVAKNIDIVDPFDSYKVNFNYSVCNIEFKINQTTTGENVISLVESNVIITLQKQAKDIANKKSRCVPFVISESIDYAVTLPINYNLGIAYIEDKPIINDDEITLGASLMCPYFDIEGSRSTLNELIYYR